MKITSINFLNALKIASIAHKTSLKIKINRQILDLLKILYKEKFILSFKIINPLLNLAEITLKPILNTNVFTNLRVYSIKSHSFYFSFQEINRLITKNSFFLLSTIQGLKSLDECKKLRLGGKVLFGL